MSEGEETVSKEMLLQRLGHLPDQQWMLIDGFHDSNFNIERFKSVGPPIVKSDRRAQLALGSGE
jgi:hypothetical protein